MENQALKTGKQCLQSLIPLTELMSNGKTEETYERLVLLKKSFYLQAEVNSKSDLVDCTHRLLELMEKRATLLSDQERNTILSFYFKSKLQMSEQELSIMSQSAKIISREGLRTVFAKEASAVTGGDSDVTQEVFKKETKLQSVVEHNKQQCRAAKVVLDMPLEKDSRRTRQISRALRRGW